jgi:chemotaxis protein histidine kinase CheA
MHAGVLPGRPASHGCIRLPYRFAEQIFDLTKMGMRVVVVRDDMSPVEIAHPALFKPGPVRPEVALASAGDRPSDAMDRRSMRLGVPPADAGTPARAQTWRQIAAAKVVQAEAAGKTAEEARRTAVRTRADAARLMKDLRMAEGARQRAETQLKDAERMLEAARSPEATQKAEEIKAKAADRLTEAQAKLDAVKAEAQPKIDAAETARAAANAAEAARVAAQNEVKLAEAKMAPVSVFISRKTQRLYVRQAFQPIFDTEVTIRDPDTPIGTTIYTALSYANDGADVRWSALAMYANGAGPDVAPASASRRGGERKAEGSATDAGAAKAALERITIPQEAIDRINEVVSPGSSLIVSDEPMSAKETGKGTDFIVLMSGEPQGGIKSRPRRSPYDGYGDDRRYRRSPYGGGLFSFW